MDHPRVRLVVWQAPTPDGETLMSGLQEGTISAKFQVLHCQASASSSCSQQHTR